MDLPLKREREREREREGEGEREAKVRGLQSSRSKQRVMKNGGHETMYILWY